MKFHVKFFLTAIWFFFLSLVVLAISLIRWRNPTNGHFFAQWLSRGAGRILGYSVVIYNESRLLAFQPCVYIGNHQDNADMVILGRSYPPNTAVIGKVELLWIPIFGLLFYAAGNILLHRQKRAKAISQMQQAEDALKKDKISIYMFPEGTRNRSAEKLLPFKKGAFYTAVAAQVPLVPIVAAPNSRIIDFKNKKIKGGTAYIEVLEPIPTLGLTEKDIPALVELAQSRMQAAYDNLKKIPI